MSLKVYNKKQENNTYFNLSKSQNNIVVEVVDNTGTRVRNGSLLTIGSEDGIILCANVDPKIGLPLDSYGRIIITEIYQ